MTVTFIPGKPPQYLFRTADLTSGSVLPSTGERVSYIGAIAINLDTNDTYRVTAPFTIEKVSESTLSTLRPYVFISGSMVTATGSSVPVTIPAGTELVKIVARGADIYYEINPTSGSASATSSGFVASGALDLVLELSNLNTFAVFGAVGAYAHIQHYKRTV